MARLPIVGGDAGNWGTILNEYLQISLASDGTLKSAAVTGSVDANARVAVAKGGTTAGTRRKINFIEGSNITITATDDSANEKVDVTIAASSSGLADPGSNGVIVRTAANTTTARTLTGTTNQVIVTNGDGVSGNPTFSLPQSIHTTASPTFDTLRLSTPTDVTGFKFASGGATVNQAAFVNTSASSAGGGAGMIGYSNDGTAQSSGDRLGFFLLGGQSGSGLSNVAGFTSYATEDWSAAAHGADLHFETTAQGAAGRVERMRINETGVALGALAPTHTLTLPYSGSGIALYNTGDTSTNYERGLLTWASNTLTLATQKGGTGANRNISIASANELRLGGSGTTFIGNDASGDVAILTGASNTRVIIEGTLSASSGTQNSVRITPTINQSGTAGYSALLINPSETALGSGANYLLDAQVGGTSKMVVETSGAVSFGTAYSSSRVVPATNELIVGHWSDVGAAFEIYSYSHATRPGEFATVFGGGVSQGQVTFIHYDGTGFNTRLSLSATGDMTLPTGGVRAQSATLGPESDTFATALTVRRNAADVGRIDNNASGMRVQALNNALFLRNQNNNGITIGTSTLTFESGISTAYEDGVNLTFGATTGTKIGTAPTEKLGFYNVTPIVQPSGSVVTALSNLGLVASPTISASDIGSGTVAIANGGTAATTAADARTNLSVAEASGFSKVTVGTTAPTSPAVGDLWVDTN